MRVLGIDPGFDRTGWGVIEDAGGKLSYIGCGCIQTSVEDAYEKRLQAVRDGLTELIQTHKPDVVAIEQLFFQTNAKTAIKVGMARGVAILAIADAGLPFVEPTPNQVKSGTTGQGNAEKKQVQEMVVRLLKLPSIPKPDDAADALAIAIVGGTLFRGPRS
ncbi:crossover junction endodeoxyribonuclease RuvC [Patescibacteria group bacterium]|jgi:crossover junction endodeoxyribonuclease RuvC|nr:crossover junction endodeoxyribonuclease RuvC [Patescibacteria group bacterium]